MCVTFVVIIILKFVFWVEINLKICNTVINKKVRLGTENMVNNLILFISSERVKVDFSDTQLYNLQV